MELRNKTNQALFELYDSQLAFRHRSANALREARRVLVHFHNYLGEYPPSGELAKGFLAQFTNRKTTTLARYVAVVKGFITWYGDELDLKIKTPKMLPDYVESGDVDKLIRTMSNRKSHKRSARRDILLVEVAVNTGLRRAELANLKVGDVDTKGRKLIVRQGKGGKDRTVLLTTGIARKLEDFISGRDKSERVFGLAAATISGKIKRWSDKAGVKLHTHSLRDRFATTLNEKGVSIRAIQELLGHTNLANTERYTLLTPRHLREAVETLEVPEEREAAQTKPGRHLMAWEQNQKREQKQLSEEVEKILAKAEVLPPDDPRLSSY